LLGFEQDPPAGARRAAERLAELEKRLQQAGAAGAREKAAALVSEATEIGDVKLVTARVETLDGKGIQELAERVRSSLGANAAVVLGSADGDSVSMVASLGPGAVERGLKAGEVVREAAAVVGGSGGGRDDFARAGGSDAGKLGEALVTARTAIETTLSNS
jgi:alanyl-tRNA synthetase